MVIMNGEKPLFFNPEDYEHELLERMRRDHLSPLFDLKHHFTAEEVDALLWSYRCCYRDVIDGTLQREILVRHHAPELAVLFEGEGRRRLEELAGRIRAAWSEEGEEGNDELLAHELERYLREHCLPGYSKSAAFYIEYFRSWVMPQLAEAKMPRRVSQPL
jgi:hypothetical protein